MRYIQVHGTVGSTPVTLSIEIDAEGLVEDIPTTLRLLQKHIPTVLKACLAFKKAVDKADKADKAD